MPTDHWADWLPTPAAVNALPEPLCRYIHDVETRCDPAGDVQDLILAQDTARAYQNEVDRLRALIRSNGGNPDAD